MFFCYIHKNNVTTLHLNFFPHEHQAHQRRKGEETKLTQNKKDKRVNIFRHQDKNKCSHERCKNLNSAYNFINVNDFYIFATDIYIKITAVYINVSDFYNSHHRFRTKTLR